MTVQEAIEKLKFRKMFIMHNEYENKEFDMAIEALEKQIPKKAIGTYTDYKCVVCGRRVRSGKGSSSRQRDNFCQRCGQRIDWGE